MRNTGPGLMVLLGFAVVLAPRALAQTTLAADDRSAIQALVSAYASALADCRADDFAELFAPGTGYFASGFRGQMVGRQKLVELVESERHCVAAAGSAPAARPGGGSGPTVQIEADATGVHGIADLGTAEYQDEYVRTPDGWRFASRTVLLASEKAAGLDAAGLLAIQKLGGDSLGDDYVPDANGVPRLMHSGVQVTVTDGVVNGRVFLPDGSYRDEVYQRAADGQWRVASSVLAPTARD